MVPMARGADFDDITSEVAFFRALGEGLQFLRSGDAAPKRWKAGPEDIRHQYQCVVLTDRTLFTGGLAHFTRRTNKFGMRITHFVLSQPTLLVFRNQMLTRESVINLAAFAARGTAEGS